MSLQTLSVIAGFSVSLIVIAGGIWGIARWLISSVFKWQQFDPKLVATMSESLKSIEKTNAEMVAEMKDMNKTIHNHDTRLTVLERDRSRRYGA